MFIGHFAVGFASKRFAPRTSLALLIAAPLLADILWPFFLLFGWERVRIDPGNTRFTPLDLAYYPWSHSLLMCAVWGVVLAGVYYGIARYRAGFVVLWIGVVSHWVLDWVTHRPDMPLYPSGPRLGLGLWNSVWGTMTVELLMLAIGVGLYVRSTRARDRIGRYAFIAYAALLVVAYIGDRFGRPPASPAEIIWNAIPWIPVMLAWAWWFDRHREAQAAA
jgi:membrane-bound metal-dependent hydrolase YbcI (DUF457 family)